MKFRVRKNTKYLRMVQVDTEGLSVLELRKKAKREGKLDISFHYLLHTNGDIETGRDSDVVAGCDLKDSETSIYIFVARESNEKTTDSQKIPLSDLVTTIKEKYPTIKKRWDSPLNQH